MSGAKERKNEWLSPSSNATLPSHFFQLQAKHLKECVFLEAEWRKQQKVDESVGEFIAASRLFSPPKPPSPPPLNCKFLILDCSAMNFLDYAGVSG